MSRPANLMYDADTGLFSGPGGEQYVECRFDNRQPVLIRVDLATWQVKHSGQSLRLAWNEYDLPTEVLFALREAVVLKLAKAAPSYVSMVKNLLHHLEILWSQYWLFKHKSFATLGLQTSLRILESLPASAASTFRELYRVLAVRQRLGCTVQVQKAMSAIRLARGKPKVFTDVLRWDPDRGALTTAELEFFRTHLVMRDPSETDHDHFVRVYLRTAVAVGKRAAQLLNAPADALRTFPNDPRFQKFIIIPGAKRQKNENAGSWPISDDLFDDLSAFAARPEVERAQRKFGYFFVTPLTKQSRADGPRHIGNVQTLIKTWIYHKGVVSPRTGEIMKVTTTRLRHTVATQMAKKGYAKADIQAMLEHSSDSAAMAYLDAVGNDMTPALELVDSALGGAFSNLRDAFFKGKVIDRPSGKVSKPVLRPDPQNISVVGQCGATGSCPKHPFFSCYNGCPYFLRFRDTDEDANRTFIEKEYQRWRRSEASATNSKAMDDFARIDRAMQEAGNREVGQ